MSQLCTKAFQIQLDQVDSHSGHSVYTALSTSHTQTRTCMTHKDLTVGTGTTHLMDSCKACLLQEVETIGKHSTGQSTTELLLTDSCAQSQTMTELTMTEPCVQSLSGTDLVGTGSCAVSLTMTEPLSTGSCALSQPTSMSPAGKAAFHKAQVNPQGASLGSAGKAALNKGLPQNASWNAPGPNTGKKHQHQNGGSPRSNLTIAGKHQKDGSTGTHQSIAPRPNAKTPHVTVLTNRLGHILAILVTSAGTAAAFMSKIHSNTLEDVPSRRVGDFLMRHKLRPKWTGDKFIKGSRRLWQLGSSWPGTTA